jgi:hypothetical protein
MVVFITPRILTAAADDLPTAEQIWREQLNKTQGDKSTAVPVAP